MKVCKMLPILRRGKEPFFSYKRDVSTINDSSIKKSKDVWIEKIILDNSKKNTILDAERESSEIASLKESFEKLSTGVNNILNRLNDDLPYFMNPRCSSNPTIAISGDYINITLTINNILQNEKFVLYPFGRKFIDKYYEDKPLILTATNNKGENALINGDLTMKYERYVILLSESDINLISLPFDIKYSGNLSEDS